MDAEAVKALIRRAFSEVEYPGDWCLRGSNEGDEPYLLEQEFKGKSDWQTLDAAFLDQAPDGFSTALCFFSDEAFRFYLPAYMIADMNGLLTSVSPVYHLTRGLDYFGKVNKVNPRRYGERTWFEAASFQMSVFSPLQVAAIIAYLEFKRYADEFYQHSVDEALKNYWRVRAAGQDD